jgi:hypothetical protein
MKARLTAPYFAKKPTDHPLHTDVEVRRAIEPLSLGTQRLVEIDINGEHTFTLAMDERGIVRLKVHHGGQVSYVSFDRHIKISSVDGMDMHLLELDEEIVVSIAGLEEDPKKEMCDACAAELGTGSCPACIAAREDGGTE